MAKEFNPPTGFRAYPDFPIPYNPISYAQYQRDCEQWEKDLIIEIKGMGHIGSLIGKRIFFPVADSYAKYVIVKQKGGIGLCHIPSGDGWRADSCTIRGVRVKDARQMCR